jgi:outer membrane lipoprotein-sorting protein
MKTFQILIISFALVVLSTPMSIAQDAEAIIDAVRKKFLLVNDYEAAVKIKVDVDFVKIPEKKGTVWFRQPDQIKVKTPGFALLPKRGMNFSPNQLFTGNYTSIFARQEKLGEHLTNVIKVIPRDDNDELILATIWVDSKRNVIRKMESSSRTDGTFVMNFTYPAEERKYDLPSEIRFDFDLRKTELPIGLTGDFENTSSRKKSPKTSKGTVTVSYLNYSINQGKGDAAFRQKR